MHVPRSRATTDNNFTATCFIFILLMDTDSLSEGVGRIMVIPISSFTATDCSANASP
jgi:hypothetical protein